MNLNDAKLTMEVVRSKGDYVVGRIGNIIDLDNEKGRVRVDWRGLNKTWVKIDCIEPANIPYEIIPAKYNAFNKRIAWPKYIKQ